MLILFIKLMKSKIQPSKPPSIIVIGILGLLITVLAVATKQPTSNTIMGEQTVLDIATEQSTSNTMMGEQVTSSQVADLAVQTNNADPNFPIRLTIPNINVDASVESVGLTAQGEVGAPRGPANVAWFNSSPLPGQNGAAIIDGHFGRWKNGSQAVFNNLHKLKVGDKLYVVNGYGITTDFVVRKMRVYDMNDDVTDVFNSDDGQAHLNLITCKGAWNKLTKSYPERLVVFTDKE